MAVVAFLALVFAIAVAFPVVVLTAECLAALLPQRRAETTAAPPRLAVLIPAHDEQKEIGHTVAAVLRQVRPEDVVLVVADNCTDKTADVARAAGAMVLQRSDPSRRGKGYALDFGVRYLTRDAPEILVVMDADCRPSDGAIMRIAAVAAATGRPVQCTYLMDSPAQASPRDLVSAFAFAVKNHVRPKGLSRLGGPCQLTGTGMAFPFGILKETPLASGNIVEDMQLGVDLGLRGHPAIFCPEAEVRSSLPRWSAASLAQRRRWEHGHLQVLLSHAPRLALAAALQGRPSLLALTLDLCVPPVSLLAVLWFVSLLLSALSAATGQGLAPLAMSLAGGGCLVLAVLAAWLVAGRSIIPLRMLLAAPWYALSKLPLYGRFLTGRQREWVRTERQPASGPEPEGATEPSRP